MEIIDVYNTLINKLNDNIVERQHWDLIQVEPSYIKDELNYIKEFIIVSNNIDESLLTELNDK